MSHNKYVGISQALSKCNKYEAFGKKKFLIDAEEP